MWPMKKKPEEHDLQNLITALSTSLGSRLVSVILFGSKASGEYRVSRSDINLLLLLQDDSFETLLKMKPALADWIKSGHGMPVCLNIADLSFYARSLPIEFLDIREYHKVLFGTDPLKGLAVSREHLRAQCCQELAVKQIKLRQALVMAQDDPVRIRTILEDALPSILTLFKAVLRLESDIPAGNKIVALKELARRVGFSCDVYERLWDSHARRETDHYQDLAEQYLVGIAQVAAYVNLSQSVK